MLAEGSLYWPTMPKAPHPGSTKIQTVAFVSLGCPKNLVDSEKMLGLLAEAGLIPTSDEAAADAIVINTCGFLEAAKDESLDEIARVAELKASGSCKRIVVAGCLTQRHGKKLLEWCPQIDALVGVFDRDRIVEAVKADAAYSSIAANAQGDFESDTARLRLTPRHFAYLRIAEGCDQKCAFCTIPAIRGRLRSKPIKAVCDEAGELIGDGAIELNLIGQDTTCYGYDIEYKPGLTGLLETLDSIAAQTGIWLRLMYAYPSRFTDRVIDAIAQLPHVLPYVDLPLQHINDRVLKAMRRHTTRKSIEGLLGKLRTRIPGVAIRTTLISGFPGETEAEHEELLRFVRDFRFEAMGVFAYSPEPGTPAEAMHRKGMAVANDVVARRVDELMLTQQDIAFASNNAMVEGAEELDVLIDEVMHEDAGPLSIGRSYHQAPQVDSVTYIRSKSQLKPGQLVRCRVVESAGYDLVAQHVPGEIPGHRDTK